MKTKWEPDSRICFKDFELQVSLTSKGWIWKFCEDGYITEQGVAGDEKEARQEAKSAVLRWKSSFDAWVEEI